MTKVAAFIAGVWDSWQGWAYRRQVRAILRDLAKLQRHLEEELGS